MLKQDEIIAKYQVNPGLNRYGGGCGKRKPPTGFIRSGLVDDISQKPHFLPKNCFIFQEHISFVVVTTAADGKVTQLEMFSEEKYAESSQNLSRCVIKGMVHVHFSPSVQYRFWFFSSSPRWMGRMGGK